jgi:hypothetical protein
VPGPVGLDSSLPWILALNTNRVRELGENLSICTVSHSEQVTGTHTVVGGLAYIDMEKLESERIGGSDPF